MPMCTRSYDKTQNVPRGDASTCLGKVVTSMKIVSSIGTQQEQCQMKPSTCGLVAMTSASHAEGRQFNPGQVYSLRDENEGK